MKFSLYRTIALCLVCVSPLHANQAAQTDPADLVKTCQNFKKAFLTACQMIAETQYTSEIKFLKENLTSGGSVIFYGVISKAIDAIVALLSFDNDPQIKELINTLEIFKTQINSDFMYDLNTGTVVKKEITRAGTTRTIHIPYNDTRCYKVAHNFQAQQNHKD